MTNSTEMQKCLNQFCCHKLSGEQLEQGVNSYGYNNYITMLKEVHNGVYENYNEIHNKYSELASKYYIINEKKSYCSLLVKAIHSKLGRSTKVDDLIAVKTKELKAAKDYEELKTLFEEMYCSVMLD